jgi:hypothetical protein
MNDTPEVGTQTFVPPPFPTWPPPSGGAPVTTPELGPVANPNYAGSTQTPTVPISPPLVAGYPPPFGSQKGTTYPQSVGVALKGQNQGPGFGLPARTKPLEVGPIKASPALSAISPLPIMGPGPQSLTWEMGPIAGTPVPGRTFPAGSYLDGISSTPL